jgi:hypothetical protein
LIEKVHYKKVLWFSNFSQSESIIGFRSHDEFHNDK